jgi:protein TonB
MGVLRRAELAGQSGGVVLQASVADAAIETPESVPVVEATVFVLPEAARIGAERVTQLPASTNWPPEVGPGTEIPPPAIAASKRPQAVADFPQVSPGLALILPPRTQPRQLGIDSSVPIASAARLPGTESKRPPSFENNSPPIYPAAAIARGQEGTVLLRLRIGADGRMLSVEVVRSSGHPILDGAAVNAVKRWRARPARIGGEAIESTEVLPVTFELR